MHNSLAMTMDVIMSVSTRNTGSPSESINLIHLNIGGQVFITSNSTLNLEYKSMLAAAVRDHVSKHGTSIPVFFDRDGRRFSHVLNYLRNGTVNSESLTLLYELQEEADFFGLQALLKLVDALIETATRRNRIEEEQREKLLSTLIHISNRLDSEHNSSTFRKMDENPRRFTLDEDF